MPIKSSSSSQPGVSLALLPQHFTSLYILQSGFEYFHNYPLLLHPTLTKLTELTVPSLSWSCKTRNWATGIGVWASFCSFILTEILLRRILNQGDSAEVYLKCIVLWHKPSRPWGGVLPCSAGDFRQTPRDTGSKNKFLLTSQDRPWDSDAELDVILKYKLSRFKLITFNF